MIFDGNWWPDVMLADAGIPVVDAPPVTAAGNNGWAYQGFNYPKSVWGGQLKAKMRKL